MFNDQILKYGRLVIFAFLLAFSSCDQPDPVIPPGADGFFVVNEGGFGNGNTSVSFYDRKSDVVTNDVFFAKNGRQLGDQAQSMTIFENKGYIVVQNSSKVEVIDPSDYSSLGTITNLPSPRYFIGITAAKAYVSDWGLDGLTGSVKVIDLATLTVTKTIPTGQGTNRFLKKGNLVYVANAGGYGKDNTVKVIDTTTDSITRTLTTGDNPNSLQFDKDGNLWVGSSGNLVYNPNFSIDEAASTKGSLGKFGPNDQEVLRLTLTSVSYSGLGQLAINPDGDQLYYTFDDKIFSIGIAATALPATPWVSKTYYGMGVDPFNGSIIGGVAPNFSSAGKIDIYNASGALQKTFDVGIAPNSFAFK